MNNRIFVSLARQPAKNMPVRYPVIYDKYCGHSVILQCFN